MTIKVVFDNGEPAAQAVLFIAADGRNITTGRLTAPLGSFTYACTDESGGCVVKAITDESSLEVFPFDEINQIALDGSLDEAVLKHYRKDVLPLKRLRSEDDSITFMLPSVIKSIRVRSAVARRRTVITGGWSYLDRDIMNLPIFGPDIESAGGPFSYRIPLPCIDCTSPLRNATSVCASPRFYVAYSVYCASGGLSQLSLLMYNTDFPKDPGGIVECDMDKLAPADDCK